MREDRFTNTEHDAGRFEQHRGRDFGYDDRPSRAEAERDAALDAEDERRAAR